MGLFLIGLAHAVFLFVGDILVAYAILGVPLYVMRDLPVRTLIKITVVLWMISIATQASLGAAVMAFPTDLTADYRGMVLLHQSGMFMAIVGQRMEELIGLYVITPFLFMPEVLGMFLLGLAAAKSFGGEGGLERARPLARSLLKWLWLPGITLNALYAFTNNTVVFNTVIALGMRGAFVPPLTLTYITAALLILDHPKVVRAVRLPGGEGRMSLSIYIGESAVMGFIAISHGLGLYGRVSPAASLLVCIFVYTTLMIGANLWLKFLRAGPMEWLLRSITEGRPVSMAGPTTS
jgi:uncharacterized protein